MLWRRRKPGSVDEWETVEDEPTEEEQQDWIKNGDGDPEFQALMRNAERLGMVESFLGEDGKIVYRVTGKQPPDGAGPADGELDS